MVSLDGAALFGEGRPEIEVGNFARERLERAAAGLDGIVSIDLGLRGREIKQRGELRARSKADLTRRVEAISEFLDGDTHTLACDGDVFDCVRLYSFKVSNERVSGSGVVADYEVVYKQLAV